ncbi:MAG: VOC family protein [Bryobacterales bacterium]|nr:VOC family protein [Bryobacterales bacterium]MDE0627833.1 VOC family protein [Bryobacterales bacterium]
MRRFSPFLLFTGEQHRKAAEAVHHYVSLFEDSEILGIDRYGPGETGPEWTVRMARFLLNGCEVRAMDSVYPRKFTFTPAISLYVECESEDEPDSAFNSLVDAGMALMPLDNYGFSKRLGWVQDKFGVSWQLNLP